MELDNNIEKKIIEWLDNIVGKPTNELGFFASGTIQRWRLMQALTTISKARDKCIALNLPLKMISPKLICPLLENCSLEDDEYMQDKWANLLVNMLDSAQNFQNHVFPYLLSQLSKSEFFLINSIYLKIFKELQEIEIKISVIAAELTERRGLGFKLQDNMPWWKQQAELTARVSELKSLKYNLLEEYEIGNLVRLGLVDKIAIIHSHAEPNPLGEKEPFIHTSHGGFKYFISGLGLVFLEACSRE